jgi:foldase protein PrsA
MRRNNLPPGHAAVFDLKPGEVSQVINDGSGYYIYKLQSKDVLPLDQVKDEIKNTLQSQRLKDSMQALQQSTQTELNDAYFNNAPPPTTPAPAPAKPNTGAGNKEPAKTPPAK